MIYRIAEEKEFLQLAHMRWDFTLDGRNIEALELDKDEFLEECVHFFRDGTNNNLWSHWIAVENDIVITSISVNHIRKVPKPTLYMDEYAYVTNVYTKPEFRGNKIASKLMDCVVEWGKKKNFELMIVWPSSKAVNYYSKIGFDSNNDLMELVLRADA